MAFNGDTQAENRVAQILSDHKIRTVIETGTYTGDSTRFFAAHCPSVITIELNQQRFEALQLDDLPNVQTIQGSSPLVLRRILSEIEEPLFIYLDAHSYNYWPLLDELQIIQRSGLKPYLMIHDFRVPRTDLGYDTYDGQALDVDYVMPVLQELYRNCDGSTFAYNDETATGARRGILYTFPSED